MGVSPLSQGEPAELLFSPVLLVADDLLVLVMLGTDSTHRCAPVLCRAVSCCHVLLCCAVLCRAMQIPLIPLPLPNITIYFTIWRIISNRSAGKGGWCHLMCV